jgi:hypothetical protein
VCNIVLLQALELVGFLADGMARRKKLIFFYEIVIFIEKLQKIK